MFRFSLIAAVALVAALAVANPDVSLELEANANLTDADSNFKFRITSAKVVDTTLIATQCQSRFSSCHIPKQFYIWNSYSVSIDKIGESKSILDGMVAVGMPPSQYVFPFALFAYGTGTASIGVSMTELLSKMFLAQGSGAFKGGAVAMAALSLEEYTPDNKYVDNTIIPLNSNECSPKELGDKGLKGMSCVMSLNNKANTNNCKVTVTYVTSDKAGILKYGQAPVSPRSIEMIVEVENFQLTDKKNHARMNLGLVTASGDVDYEGNAKVIMKDDQKVYVAASGYAVVNGKRTEVKVNMESGSLPEDLKGTFDAVVGVAIDGNMDISIAHVDFPAGASDFVYDPAAGTGSNVYMAGASTITLSLLAFLVCSLLFLF